MQISSKRLIPKILHYWTKFQPAFSKRDLAPFERVADLGQYGVGTSEDVASLDQDNLETEGLEELEPGAETVAGNGVAAVNFNDNGLLAADVFDGEGADSGVTNEFIWLQGARLQQSCEAFASARCASKGWPSILEYPGEHARSLQGCASQRPESVSLRSIEQS
jgi:hypothetical protein